MHSVLRAAIAALVLTALAACMPEGPGPSGHPNLVIVREFAFSPGVVTLDPSFGFSLYRGEAGVPPRQRATGVARAAAFNVADSITQQLAAAGYDVVRSDTASAEPGGRALVISGTFRQINEGYRRRVGAENAHVAAEVAVDYQTAGAAPSRLMNFALDSRQVPVGGVIGVSARRGTDVHAAAVRLGAAVANAVLSLIRRENWPAAGR
jgi:hypothetical protein